MTAPKGVFTWAFRLLIPDHQRGGGGGEMARETTFDAAPQYDKRAVM